MKTMESARIADLLAPFTTGDVADGLPDQLRLYLDVLLRWNARINLTAVRNPEEIVTRHFGESLFAARLLLSDKPFTLADVGSGPGFPGVPIKLYAPQTKLTLVESQTKKATFLRELIRTLQLPDAEVFGGRAEHWARTADVVTLRAVEKFEGVLPTAADLVAPDGRLCLLIGSGQLAKAQEILKLGWSWRHPVAIPQSAERVVAIADKSQ